MQKNTHFSAHGTFSKIDYILGHKANLNKFKKTEILSSIFSHHNAMRLGMLRFMGSQRIGHNWLTELNWTELSEKKK